MSKRSKAAAIRAEVRRDMMADIASGMFDDEQMERVANEIQEAARRSHEAARSDEQDGDE